MCGVAGLVDLAGDAISPVVLKRMTDSIEHRGPDDEGHWIEGNVALGHRRLSIIDLSPAGHQPMISPDHRFVLTYNGEIYNFRELKAELEAKGFWFRSNTDTEVVLHALSCWGTNALLRFNGMFGLALWDRQKGEMLLARDRYGIKPLYYSKQGKHFAFGSEQKVITENPYFRKQLNKKALAEYLTFQNILSDQTLLEDIHLLPAGYWLKLNISNGQIHQEKYWDYEFKETYKTDDKTECLEELDRLFKQAVNRQLIGDVELGSYLSGGMDSGSITAIASQSFKNLKTFTCGFDLSSASGLELAFDERAQAESLSALFKSEHYEMVLKSGDMERCLQDLAWHLEEPRVGQSYPNYYAAKLASKFVKVVLTGTGGDELFGGYPWRYYRAVNSKSWDDYVDNYFSYWQRLVNQSQIKRIFRPIQDDLEGFCSKQIFKDVFNSTNNSPNQPEDYINYSLYFEAKTFLHGLFVVEDKLSMAHSLENRVPFMDNDLVDFAMRCPVSLKLNNIDNVVSASAKSQNNFYKKNNDGKQILRDVMQAYVPSVVTTAPKQGFSSPDASWFKGESVDFVNKQLVLTDAAIYDVMDRKEIKNLIMEHLDGKQNRRLLIWSLLNIEAWMQAFL